MNILRTNSEHEDFIRLVQLLDADLAKRDGAEHAFFAQFNKIDAIKYVVLVYENDIPLGCGAIKYFNAHTMEIKRMYTSEESRGKGIASKILAELENWTKELSFKKCVLETGVKQPEAIGLYQKNGYNKITNYGQYANVESSICFEKLLN